MKKLYTYLDKRKSIRTVEKNNSLTNEDIQNINYYLKQLKPLFNECRIRTELVKNNKTNSKIGEYNLLIYSTKPESKNSNYLLNIGYMFEQLDLYLFSINIGCCWLGLPKPKGELKDNEYVIMIGLAKIKEDDLRKDLSDFKRKPNEETWVGEFNKDVIEKSCLAPSACNSQSWKVKAENNTLYVYRDKNIKTIIPRGFRRFFNSIDLGIYLCFLEIALLKNNYKFNRTIINDEFDNNDLILIARYEIYE